jgi:hypothetical protein
MDNIDEPVKMSQKRPPSGNFMDVKIGDTVTRNFYGYMQPLEVTGVDDILIYTKGGWNFDRATGFEEDPEIGMGVAFGITCSFLTVE